MLHKHSNNETWWGTQMNNSWSEAQPKVIKRPFIDIKMNYFMLFCECFTSSACDIQHKYIYINNYLIHDHRFLPLSWRWTSSCMCTINEIEQGAALGCKLKRSAPERRRQTKRHLAVEVLLDCLHEELLLYVRGRMSTFWLNLVFKWGRCQ